jgi:hypothetical protein
MLKSELLKLIQTEILPLMWFSQQNGKMALCVLVVDDSETVP